MRFPLLLDTCISPRTRDSLAADGYDVVWAGDWDSDPGDEEILGLARKQSRILITLDKDFGELAVIFGRKHNGIIRLVDIPVNQQAVICFRTLVRYGPDLQLGALVTVGPGRTRVRPHLHDVMNEPNSELE
jgi:predicted nuclease of predicted toxin-antitoxin system